MTNGHYLREVSQADRTLIADLIDIPHVRPSNLIEDVFLESSPVHVRRKLDIPGENASGDVSNSASVPLQQSLKNTLAVRVGNEFTTQLLLSYTSKPTTLLRSESAQLVNTLSNVLIADTVHCVCIPVLSAQFIFKMKFRSIQPGKTMPFSGMSEFSGFSDFKFSHLRMRMCSTDWALAFKNDKASTVYLGLNPGVKVKFDMNNDVVHWSSTCGKANAYVQYRYKLGEDAFVSVQGSTRANLGLAIGFNFNIVNGISFEQYAGVSSHKLMAPTPVYGFALNFEMK
jgi:hypothetical protein